MKICSTCKIEKSYSFFPKNKNRKDGYHTSCKLCRKEYNEKNKDLIKLQEKIRYQKSPQKFRNRTIEYNKNNPEKSKEYYLKNREKEIKRSVKYKKKKYKEDPLFRLEAILRARLIDYVSRDSKSESAKDLLGCTLEEFKYYISKQFLPEMNWDNHGDIWQIDHIIPCIKFDLSRIEDQKRCYHYSNMRPLFKTTQIAENFGYNNIVGNLNRKKSLHNGL